jgi:hypothetical protein
VGWDVDRLVVCRPVSWEVVVAVDTKWFLMWFVGRARNGAAESLSPLIRPSPRRIRPCSCRIRHFFGFCSLTAVRIRSRCGWTRIAQRTAAACADADEQQARRFAAPRLGSHHGPEEVRPGLGYRSPTESTCARSRLPRSPCCSRGVRRCLHGPRVLGTRCFVASREAGAHPSRRYPPL